jgi:hypothetical protein
LVDDDLAHLSNYFWTLAKGGYAARHVGGRIVFMHHDVAGRMPGRDVSHENADKLDNRRSNLRHVTRGVNVLNPSDGPRRDNLCGVRGVSYDPTCRRHWFGRFKLDSVTYRVGGFFTPEEAGVALEAQRARVRVAALEAQR